MKFSCETCRTSYSISDDKIRGKILTIRCRRCQSVIVVRDPNAPTDDEQPKTTAGAGAGHTAASSPVSAPPPPPKTRTVESPATERGAMGRPGVGQRLDFDAGDDEFDRAIDKIGGDASPPAPPPPVSRRPPPVDTVIAEFSPERLRELQAAPTPSPAPPESPLPSAPVWFLGVSGEQRGPLPLGEVRALFSSGDVLGDALVWKAGMDNWVAATSVEAFADVVKPVAPPVAQPAPTPVVADSVEPPQPTASVSAPSQALPARSPLRIARPIDPAFSDFGEPSGTMMLDAGSILSIEEIPRRRPPSKARVAVMATLGIIGVSGAIVGLMVAVGAIDLFGTEKTTDKQESRNELLHVEGAGPLVFRDTKIIEIYKEGRRRGGGREGSSAGPLTGTPPPSARAGADMNTAMRIGNSGGPAGVEPSTEMRRLFTTSSGLVESGPIERPVSFARRERDEPSADDAQRFQRLFSSTYKRSVTGCYNKALKVDSSLQGSIILTMELNERSKIKTLAMSRFRGSQFETCVKESSRSWKFAGVSPGTTIEYTINLARTE